MTDRSVTNTRQRRPEARPAEILAAALDCFSERGYSATRMTDVASRAGLSKAAIYLYFKDKMALLQALVETTVGDNLVQAQGLATLHQGPVGPLLAQVLGMIAGRIGQSRLPELMKIIISESRAHPEIGRFYLDNVINRGLPIFESLIRRGVAQGEFRPVDPVITVKSMIGPMLLAGIWRTVFEPLGGEPLDLDAYVRHNQDMLLRGLRP
jgi:AcrR family transcriptional regulator